MLIISIIYSPDVMELETARMQPMKPIVISLIKQDVVNLSISVLMANAYISHLHVMVNMIVDSVIYLMNQNV